jgi:nicotinate-nucleotide pyrophosphorylase (carboxylating)
MGLFDMILVKDNHIDAAGSLVAAVNAAQRAQPGLPLEVEVGDLAELDQALTLDPYPDRVMLDNMERRVAASGSGPGRQTFCTPGLRRC